MKRILAASVAAAALAGPALADPVQLGPRPYFLVDQMADGALRDELAACADTEMAPKLFSIGHRGAPLQFPEHTRKATARPPDGRRHPRVRRDLHRRQGAGLPPRAERPPHHDEHPRDRSRRQLHDTVRARIRRHRRHGGVPHLRPDARRVQDAHRQDGRRRPGGDDARGLHGRARRRSAPTSTPRRAAR